MPEPTYKEHASEDAGGQADAFDWSAVEYCQVEAGRYGGHVSHLGLGGLSLRREWQNRDIHKRGAAAGDFCTLSFFEERVDCWCNGRRYELPFSPVFFLPAGGEIDIYVKGGTTLGYVVLDQPVLRSRAQILEPALPPWRKGDMSVMSNDSRPLIGLMATVQERRRLGVRTDWAALATRFTDILATGMAGSSRVQAPLPSSFAAKHQVLRRARNYISDCLDQETCPSIVDVCRKAGVSQRTLQYCFVELMQMTPMAFLRILRLNRARSELGRPDAPGVSVTEVATRHAFWHLGNFARDFRLHFGETPSEVLARGRRRAGCA